MFETLCRKLGTTKTNLLYTTLIFLCHLAYGITFNLIWPALVDLAYIYDVSLETINYLSVSSGIGYLLGSLSGFLYKWINKQLYLSLMTLLLAITIMFVPFYNKIVCLFIAFSLSAVGGGSWDSSNNVWLVEMWPDKQGFVMQALQFMYGIGSIISPTLVSPFVYGLNNSTDITPEKRKHSLALPFALVGCIQALSSCFKDLSFKQKSNSKCIYFSRLQSVPLILLVLYFVNRFERPQAQDYPKPSPYDSVEKVEQQQTTKPVQKKQTSWRKLKLTFVTITIAAYNVTELACFFYLATVLQYSEAKLSAQQAAYVMAVLSAFYTFGRFLTAFISLKLSPDVIIIYHFAILILSQTLFYFDRSITMIYVSSALRGYGLAAMWPAIMSFTEKHLKLSDKVSTLLFVFASIGTVSVPILIGPHLETTPTILFVFQAISTTISIISFTIVKLLIMFRP